MKIYKTDGTLFTEGPEKTMRELVERLAREGVSLEEAGLSGADLSGAYGLGILAEEVTELRVEMKQKEKENQ